MEGPGIDPLAAGLAAGDERAFAELYQRFGERLYRVALGILGRREDAEDAVQELILGIVRSQASLARVQDITSYLFTSLRWVAARYSARQKKEPVISSFAVEIFAQTDPGKSTSDGDRLQRALASLPLEQRELIAMKIDGELTFAQIAQVLGINANTAASRYRYALEKLRNSLGGKP